jgi:hypothetical protein
MNPFYLEIELFKPVENFLKQKGYHVKREIRIGYCRADIVGFKNNVVLSVELKLNNWKKAIIQAKNYQLGSDYVYIGFPLQNIHKILRKAKLILIKENIGLLSINEKTNVVNVIIKANKSRRMIGRINLNKIHIKSKNKFIFFLFIHFLLGLKL